MSNLPHMTVDPARPGVILFDGEPMMTGMLAGMRAPDIAIACNSYQAMRDAQPEDEKSRMVRISKLIADLQSIKDRFGDTCVYIRTGGMSWGAVALNRESDDEKNGVFDLEASYEVRLVAYAEQVERLIADKQALLLQVGALTPKG